VIKRSKEHLCTDTGEEMKVLGFKIFARGGWREGDRVGHTGHRKGGFGKEAQAGVQAALRSLLPLKVRTNEGKVSGRGRGEKRAG